MTAVSVARSVGVTSYAIANGPGPGAVVVEERDPLERSSAPRELTGVIEPEGIVESPVAGLTPEHDEAVLIVDGEPAQEQGLGHGEDGRREADPQGEGEDRGEGEPRGAAEPAERVAHARGLGLGALGSGGAGRPLMLADVSQLYYNQHT